MVPLTHGTLAPSECTRTGLKLHINSNNRVNIFSSKLADNSGSGHLIQTEQLAAVISSNNKGCQVTLGRKVPGYRAPLITPIHCLSADDKTPPPEERTKWP